LTRNAEKRKEHTIMKNEGRKASTAAHNRYNKKTYEQIAIRVKKGIRARFNTACAAAGISGADYITRCIMELIEKYECSNSVIAPGAENSAGAGGNESDI
jgi:predicted HicB family RNase H-like nuclease